MSTRACTCPLARCGSLTGSDRTRDQVGEGCTGGRGERGKLKVEVENALDALDRQTLVEASRSGKARMVYTDDTVLLWNAIKYHRGRLEDVAKDVGEELGKARL